MSSNKALRLQVFLAHAGIASRRKSEEYILKGRVRVNGTVIKTLGTKVTEEDSVTVDGVPVKRAEKKVYLVLHKPTKYVCSNYDPDNRPLAIDLIKKLIPERVYNVGRLDYLTSGLLLFTNDGSFAEKMLHPSYNVEKEYIVVTKKEIPSDLMEEFKKGIIIDGIRYKAKEYLMRGPRTVHLILEEGKNREIRNVFLSRNIFVKKVHRIRLGGVRLKGIAPGHFRMLKPWEVQNLIGIAEGKVKNPGMTKTSKTIERSDDSEKKGTSGFGLRKPKKTERNKVSGRMAEKKKPKYAKSEKNSKPRKKTRY